MEFKKGNRVIVNSNVNRDSMVYISKGCIGTVTSDTTGRSYTYVLMDSGKTYEVDNSFLSVLVNKKQKSVYPTHLIQMDDGSRYIAFSMKDALSRVEERMLNSSKDPVIYEIKPILRISNRIVKQKI